MRGGEVIRQRGGAAPALLPFLRRARRLPRGFQGTHEALQAWAAGGLIQSILGRFLR